MNKILVLLLLLVVSACNNGSKEVKTAELETQMNEEIKIESPSNSLNIPIVDYEELAPLLNKSNDSTYVINFWATWCKPCIKELPYFEAIGEKYSSKKVKVILVSLDIPKLLEKQVIPFIKKNNLQSEVILFDDPDANSWIPKIDESWSGAIPATIIYNNKNRKFFEKSFTMEELESEIKLIL